MAAASAALGLPARRVLLADYDRRWPELYQLAAERLHGALGHELAIEHVGSTAVPGLAAKPVIDLLVGTASLASAGLAMSTLASLDFRFRPDDPLAGRRYFTRDDAHGCRTHHLHWCVQGGAFWNDHLRFRDALRADRALADEYLALKRDLARRHPHDRLAYTNGKDAFIRRVLAGT